MREMQLPFRDDWFLAENLRAQGFVVKLAVTRSDGADLADLDQRTVRAAVVALATADRDAYRAFREKNVAQAKARKAKRKAPAKPRAAKPPSAPASKPARPRAAAKRPSSR